jgi:hypothetical protein
MNQSLPPQQNPKILTGDPDDDRKMGLEYVMRQHPWATPGAEAQGIVDAGAPQADSTALSRIDPVLRLVAACVKKLSEDPIYGVEIINTVGQWFIRPSLLVNSVSNLCEANVVLCLAEGERLPGRKSLRVGIAVNGLPVTGLAWHFSRAMVVRQLYTTSGPTATASLTIGGTWASGQIYTATIRTPNPASPTAENPLVVSLPYTTVIGDATNAGAAASFVAVWNANPTLAALAVASVSSGSTILLTAVNAGSLIQQSLITTSATGAGTFTLASAFTGAANPEVGLAFE